jgi:hypothetical protein
MLEMRALRALRRLIKQRERDLRILDWLDEPFR